MGHLGPWMGSIVALSLAAAGADAGVPVTLAVRDAAGAPVPEAVVYLDGGVHGPVAQPRKVVIDQRDKVFVPRVTVIQVGTDISFPNSDSVSHHVYSFARPNAFELPLYKGGARPIIRFDHAGVVTLGCNIHDSMLGYVIVVDTPHFATADEAGNAAFPDVPPGTYQVQVWSERINAAKPVPGGAITVGAQAFSGQAAVARKLRAAPGGGGSLSAGDY